jgi:hypothetical protein
MNAACFAGSNLREIAAGLRCSTNAVQQSDQPGAVLVLDATFPRDPRANRASATGVRSWCSSLGLVQRSIDTSSHSGSSVDRHVTQSTSGAASASVLLLMYVTTPELPTHDVRNIVRDLA